MSSTHRRRLFVFPASGRVARIHIASSIAQSIDPNVCEMYFPKQLLEKIKNGSSDGKFYAWGSAPGPKNTRNWFDMEPGDHVLFYQGGRYTYASRVLFKDRNAGFAQELWGSLSSHQTWELVCFLDRPTRVSFPTEDVSVLPKVFMGFTQIKSPRIQEVIEQYGSVEALMSHITGSGSPKEGESISDREFEPASPLVASGQGCCA